MFGPKRKLGKRASQDIDPLITQDMYEQYNRTLQTLKKVEQPKLRKEVMELAEGGDFSENAGYQAAKHQLRTVNAKIFSLEQRIKQAKIIQKDNSGFVMIGSTVTIELSGKTLTYTILGSVETNPAKGVISYTSPLGMALMNKRQGEKVEFAFNGKKQSVKILKVE